MPSEPSPIALDAALGAPDAEERRQATSQLVRLAVADAVPLLVRALGDDDWRVRKEATVVARLFGGAPALVAAVVRALAASDNIGLRNAAVEVLSFVGHAATAAVGAALGGFDADGRKLAMEVLGRSRDSAALGPLAAARRDPDANVRQAAIEGIAALAASSNEPMPRELLRHCLEDADPCVRLTALQGMNTLGVSLPWPQLERLLGDPIVRSTALSAVALSDSSEAAPALVRALHSARGTSFAEALTALARLAGEGTSGDAEPSRTGSRAGQPGDPKASIGAGRPAWTREDPTPSRLDMMRVHVAEALRAQVDTLGPRLVRAAAGEVSSSIDLQAVALRMAALARAPGIFDVAIRALSEQALAGAAHRALILLGRTAVPGILARLGVEGGAEAGAFDPEIRAVFIDVLATEAEAIPEVLTALRGAAREPDRQVATTALFALSRVGDEADLGLAADLVTSPSLPIAQAAERCLATLASRFPSSARELARRRAAADPQSLSATTLLGALGWTGQPTLSGPGADLDFLTHAITADSARTRSAAVAAVAQIGGATALHVLGFALADEERDVQLAAARALGRLCAGPQRMAGSAPPPGPTEVLEIVGRSSEPDLIAAAVRSLGDTMEGLTTGRGGRSERPPPPSLGRAGEADGAPSDALPLGAGTGGRELIAALDPLTRSSASVVAIAAVDALGRIPGHHAARRAALTDALGHADDHVVRAAMLKLSALALGSEESPEIGAAIADDLGRCLDHASAEIRSLAAEMLGEVPSAAALVKLAQRAASEPDRDVREVMERALTGVRGRGADR